MIIQVLLFCVIIGGCLFGLYLFFKGAACLFQRKIRSGLLYLVVGIPLFLALAAFILLPAIVCHPPRDRRSQCMNNLSQIGKACMMYSMDHNEAFPHSFSQITNFLPNPKVFVCSSSGHKPGPLHLVDQWTDYVLVTNVSAASRSDHVVAYGRPENHDGKGCHVLFVDGSVIWVSPKDFTNLTCNVKSHSKLNTREPQPEH